MVALVLHQVTPNATAHQTPGDFVDLFGASRVAPRKPEQATAAALGRLKCAVVEAAGDAIIGADLD